MPEILMIMIKQGGNVFEKACANIRLIGTMVAHFLHFLHKEFSLELFNVHIIGHSLGAQLAG